MNIDLLKNDIKKLPKTIVYGIAGGFVGGVNKKIGHYHFEWLKVPIFERIGRLILMTVTIAVFVRYVWFDQFVVIIADKIMLSLLLALIVVNIVFGSMIWTGFVYIVEKLYGLVVTVLTHTGVFIGKLFTAVLVDGPATLIDKLSSKKE